MPTRENSGSERMTVLTGVRMKRIARTKLESVAVSTPRCGASASSAPASRKNEALSRTLGGEEQSRALVHHVAKPMDRGHELASIEALPAFSADLQLLRAIDQRAVVLLQLVIGRAFVGDCGIGAFQHIARDEIGACPDRGRGEEHRRGKVEEIDRAAHDLADRDHEIGQRAREAAEIADILLQSGENAVALDLLDLGDRSRENLLRHVLAERRDDLLPDISRLRSRGDLAREHHDEKSRKGAERPERSGGSASELAIDDGEEGYGGEAVHAADRGRDEEPAPIGAKQFNGESNDRFELRLHAMNPAWFIVYL